MIQLMKMAYRDLGRNRRRSFFSALALGLGIGLLMLMAAMIRGEMGNALDSSIRLQTGHLQVRPATYKEGKYSLDAKDLIAKPVDLATQIASNPLVQSASPRLFISGMVAHNNDSVGVSIMGIDPASATSDPYRSGLVSGEFLTADDREGVELGYSLAGKLGLKAGDKIDLLVNTSSGTVAEQVFNVRGLITTHYPSYDQSLVLMPLDKAQAIAQAGDNASVIFIMLKDKGQTTSAAAAVTGLAGDNQVTDWAAMNSVLSSLEQFALAYEILLYLIVLAITATVIVNTLVMAVFERTREIGILSALGMRSWRIMAMFFAESFMLAVGGVGIGLVLGGLLSAYGSYVGFGIPNIGYTGILIGERLYGRLTLGDTVSLVVAAFVVTLVAALYPALLAARMEPVDALRGGKQA